MVKIRFMASSVMLLLADSLRASPISKVPRHAGLPNPYSVYICNGADWTGDCQNMIVAIGVCYENPYYLEGALSIGPSNTVIVDMNKHELCYPDSVIGWEIIWPGEKDLGGDERATTRYFKVWSMDGHQK